MPRLYFLSSGGTGFRPSRPEIRMGFTPGPIQGFYRPCGLFPESGKRGSIRQAARGQRIENLDGYPGDSGKRILLPGLSRILFQPGSGPPGPAETQERKSHLLLRPGREQPALTGQSRSPVPECDGEEPPFPPRSQGGKSGRPDQGAPST